MAASITGPVEEHWENAEVGLDAIHVVQLATDSLDEVHRSVWNDARRSGVGDQARS